MNEKILPPKAAWEDFWKWVKSQPEWEGFTRKQKQYLDKTNRQVLAGTVGLPRLTKALDKYAPGRYEFRGGFIIHEQ